MKQRIVLTALALSAAVNLSLAQDPKPASGGPPPQAGPAGAPGGRSGGPGGPGGQRPINPIIEVLDLNKDGVIDAEELAKATESLKKLDKNGDGKLTEDEFRPQRSGGPGGQGVGQGPGAGAGRGGPQGGAPGGTPGGPGQGGPQGGAQRPPLEP